MLPPAFDLALSSHFTPSSCFSFRWMGGELRNDVQGVIRVLNLRKYPLRLWYLPSDQSPGGLQDPNIVDVDGDLPAPVALPDTAEERAAQGWLVGHVARWVVWAAAGGLHLDWCCFHFSSFFFSFFLFLNRPVL